MDTGKEIVVFNAGFLHIAFKARVLTPLDLARVACLKEKQ